MCKSEARLLWACTKSRKRLGGEHEEFHGEGSGMLKDRRATRAFYSIVASSLCTCYGISLSFLYRISTSSFVILAGMFLCQETPGLAILDGTHTGEMK